MLGECYISYLGKKRQQQEENTWAHRFAYSALCIQTRWRRLRDRLSSAQQKGGAYTGHLLGAEPLCDWISGRAGRDLRAAASKAASPSRLSPDALKRNRIPAVIFIIFSNSPIYSILKIRGFCQLLSFTSYRYKVWERDLHPPSHDRNFRVFYVIQPIVILA